MKQTIMIVAIIAIVSLAVTGCIDSGDGDSDANNTNIDPMDDIAIEPTKSTESAQTSSCINVEYPIDITLYLFGQGEGIPATVFTLEKDGAVSARHVGDSEVQYAIWTYTSQSESEYSYTSSVNGADSIEMTIYADGTATGTSFLSGADLSHGTWESTDAPKTIVTSAHETTPRPVMTATVSATKTVESGFVMEYPFLVSVTGTGTQEGINSIIMIDDDGKTCYHYVWCGMDVCGAGKVALMDITHNGNSITYDGTDPLGKAVSITVYETERGGGRATQVGFDAEADCTWNPWDNVPKTITNKLTAYR